MEAGTRLHKSQLISAQLGLQIAYRTKEARFLYLTKKNYLQFHPDERIFLFVLLSTRISYESDFLEDIFNRFSTQFLNQNIFKDTDVASCNYTINRSAMM
jgi:hypothetical protein